jgi:hypothetical protein
MDWQRWFGIFFAVSLALLLAWWASLKNSALPDLRSQHSQPAIHPAASVVEVVDAGKTFHKEGCRYLHGRGKTEKWSTATHDGYTPCVHCERDVLTN